MHTTHGYTKSLLYCHLYIVVMTRKDEFAFPLMQTFQGEGWAEIFLWGTFVLLTSRVLASARPKGLKVSIIMRSLNTQDHHWVEYVGLGRTSFSRFFFFFWLQLFQVPFSSDEAREMYNWQTRCLAVGKMLLVKSSVSFLYVSFSSNMYQQKDSRHNSWSKVGVIGIFRFSFVYFYRLTCTKPNLTKPNLP